MGAAADTFPPLISRVDENNKAIAELIAKVSVTMAALADTTGPDFLSLFDSIHRSMSAQPFWRCRHPSSPHPAHA